METQTSTELLNFGILSFANDKFSPYSVERRTDGVFFDGIFTIGDYVTNGTQMKGHIERFELSTDLKTLFVYTDWSGVGMNLDSIKKIERLPSKHQVGDVVKFYLVEDSKGVAANIRAVHFYFDKVKYDIEVVSEANSGGLNYTRLYNVDSNLIKRK